MSKIIEKADRLERVLEELAQYIQAMDQKREAWAREWDQKMGARRKEWEARWEKEKKALNKQWGDLANKLGTIVEDLFAPSLPQAIEKQMGWRVISISCRLKVKVGGEGSGI